MQTLIHRIIFIILILILGITPGFSLEPKEPKNFDLILTKLEEHIQENIKKKRIPGCAVAVVYRNKIIFMNGYGVQAFGKEDKVDVNTLFQLGSVSKPIAATVAAILEQKGRLKLDAPVNEYLPNFTLKSKESADSFKVKHVLSHSSGVPRAGFNNLIESFATYDYIMKVLQTTAVRAKVGKKYDYNNAMYSLIAEITEAATLLKFEDNLKINLLQPLNMTRTSASLEGITRSTNKACPHTRDRRGKLAPCPTYSSGYYTVAPAGGINSSIRDMAIFLKAQLGGYPEVINHRVLARLQSPQVATQNMLQGHSNASHHIKNAQYGLGFRMVDYGDQKLIFHGGWVKGFTSYIAFIPDEQVGIVVLQNADTKFSSQTALKFLDLYYGRPEKINNLSSKDFRARFLKKIKDQKKSKASSKITPKAIKPVLKKGNTKVIIKKASVKKTVASSKKAKVVKRQTKK